MVKEMGTLAFDHIANQKHHLQKPESTYALQKILGLFAIMQTL
jgi:hypothetical protein